MSPPAPRPVSPSARSRSFRTVLTDVLRFTMHRRMKYFRQVYRLGGDEVGSGSGRRSHPPYISTWIKKSQRHTPNLPACTQRSLRLDEKSTISKQKCIYSCLHLPPTARWGEIVTYVRRRRTHACMHKHARIAQRMNLRRHMFLRMHAYRRRCRCTCITSTSMHAHEVVLKGRPKKQSTPPVK